MAKINKPKPAIKKSAVKKPSSKKPSNKPKTSRQMINETALKFGKNPLKKNLDIGEFESYNTKGSYSGKYFSDDGIYGRPRSGKKIDKASRKGK